MPITFGRHSSSKVVFHESMISRTHASICFINNRFYLREESSSFGTLLKLQENTKVQRERLTVQMDRCLFEFRVLPQ
jgi:pSer/pThr/pTyr-binding forkhead associated (FHA) protein